MYIIIHKTQKDNKIIEECHYIFKSKKIAVQNLKCNYNYIIQYKNIKKYSDIKYDNNTIEYTEGELKNIIYIEKMEV